MSIKQGEYLKDLRVKNNYSQEKLGELLGLSRQSISKWEQGYAIPDTENLLKLSELYGVSVDALLKCGGEAHRSETENAAETNAKAVDQNNAEAVKEAAPQTVDAPVPDTAQSNDELPAQAERPAKKKRGWFFLSFPFLAVIAYAVIGALFHSKGWAFGWTVLLTIPVYYTGVIACEKKKPLIFCYPALAAIIYVILGIKYGEPGWLIGWTVLLTIPLYYTGVMAVEKKKPVIFCYPALTLIVFFISGYFNGNWHPMWIIFLTIPVFYIIAAKAGKNK